jgi:hypothetical protein
VKFGAMLTARFCVCFPGADISQRHTREIMERDLTSLKADLRALQRQEVSLLQSEIASLEKRVRVPFS